MKDFFEKIRRRISAFVAFCPWGQDEHGCLPKQNVVQSSRHGVVGFTCGAFDLMHAGHILMLQEAKEQCDYLIVGLQYNPAIDRPEKNRPVQTYEERTIILGSVKYVDEIVFYESEADLVKLLEDVNPDIRIIGADWRGKKFTGCDLPINVYYNSREHKWSTSNLRRRIFASELRKRSASEEKKVNKK